MAEGTTLVWTAQPKQRAFLKATEDEVFYGGAAGGGKTDAMLIDFIRTCVKYPNAQTVILRRTYADLSKAGAIIARSHELLDGTGPHWSGNTHTWTFPNKAILQFGHIQHSGDEVHWQGAQIDRLGFEEITQFLEAMYHYLNSRVRSRVEGLKAVTRATGNPGGVGHGWVRKRWIDAAPWGTTFQIIPEGEDEAKSARFIPAKLEDNKKLLEIDPGYAKQLNALPEALRKALRDGNWDVFIGQVFTEFDRNVHVVDPFPIPREWQRWRAVDWGFAKPMCCLWFAKSPKGKTYVYRELYATHLVDDAQAKTILAMSPNEPSRTPNFLDPSMWSTDPNGTSVAQTYGKNGLYVVKANNDRISGWQRVHEALATTDADNLVKEPEIAIFANCLNLIRTLPTLVYDSTRVEDVDSEGEDHAGDSFRYGVMGERPTVRRIPRQLRVA